MSSVLSKAISVWPHSAFIGGVMSLATSERDISICKSGIQCDAWIWALKLWLYGTFREVEIEYAENHRLRYLIIVANGFVNPIFVCLGLISSYAGRRMFHFHLSKRRKMSKVKGKRIPEIRWAKFDLIK